MVPLYDVSFLYYTQILSLGVGALALNSLVAGVCDSWVQEYGFRWNMHELAQVSRLLIDKKGVHPLMSSYNYIRCKD